MGNMCGGCDSKATNMSILNSLPTPTCIVEERFHGCTIRISQGDLLKESTDAIMAIIDSSLSFQGQLCRQIMQLAGRQLINDIVKIQQNKPNYEYGQVFYTHAGDLDYDFIFYGVLPPLYSSDCVPKRRSTYIEGSVEAVSQQFASHKDQRQFVFHCITETLKQAEDLQLNSVSLPVISAETSTSMTATIMLVAIKAFIEDTHQRLQHLNLINITILNNSLVPTFKAVFDKVVMGLTDHLPDLPDPQSTPVLAGEMVSQYKKDGGSFHELHPPNTLEHTNAQENEYSRFGHRCTAPTKLRLERKESI